MSGEGIQDTGGRNQESASGEPDLGAAVDTLICEFYDTAALRAEAGDENAELAFKACAERVSEVFAEYFGEKAKYHLENLGRVQKS